MQPWRRLKRIRDAYVQIRIERRTLTFQLAIAHYRRSDSSRGTTSYDINRREIAYEKSSFRLVHVVPGNSTVHFYFSRKLAAYDADYDCTCRRIKAKRRFPKRRRRRVIRSAQFSLLACY